MKKNVALVLLLILCFSLAFTACKKEPAQDSLVSIPMVGQQTGSDHTKDEESASNLYPLETVGDQVADGALMYPVDPESPDYDEKMETWVNELLDSQHTLDFVLSQTKTAIEWRELITNDNHAHLELTEGQIQALINWLIDRTN